MADLHDDDRTAPNAGLPAAGMNRTPERDPEHLLPDHTTAGAPGTIAASDDPDVVRDEIERTRERMSRTIDSIEGALLRKKERIEERLDVFAPVRERPLAAAGGVFGAGLLLGFLTGGKDEDDEDYVRIPRSLAAGMGAEGGSSSQSGGSAFAADEDWHGRARDWEERARELMQTCARQEEEIQRLRGGTGYVADTGYGGGTDYAADAGYAAGTGSDYLPDAEYSGGGTVDYGADASYGELHYTGGDLHLTGEDEFTGDVYGADTSYASGEMDVEVDLEERGGYYENTGELDVEVELEETGGPDWRRAVALAAGGILAGAVSKFVAGRLTGGGRREMEVEVELERPRTAGYRVTGTETGYRTGGEMEVEVDLEPRGGFAGDRGYDTAPGLGTPPPPESGYETTQDLDRGPNAGYTRPPQDPPLM